MEYNRIKRNSFELVKNDFWIQLAIGAYRCDLIPSPIVEGKEEVKEKSVERPQFLEEKIEMLESYVQ